MTYPGGGSLDELLTSTGTRPRLLPSNRKLRHLQGITLRNLNKEPHIGRHRGKTIDDEALPYALKSPAKLLPLHERHKLVHSRSHDDLKPPSTALGERAEATDNFRVRTELLLKTPPRPKTPRRRSTLEWFNSTPAERQLSLLDAVERRTADVFFSLHVVGVKDPIYISEVIEHTTNPNFRSFDLAGCSARITRQSVITVKVWVTSGANWTCLLELTIVLSALRFIGTSFDHLRRGLSDNSLVFSLSDGIYVSAADLLSRVRDTSSALLDSKATTPGPVESSCTYDTLMRLATLDECIQDAIAIREKLTAEIDRLVANNKDAYFSTNRLVQNEDSQSHLQNAVSLEHRNVKSLRSKLQRARSTLRDRKETIATGRATHENVSSTLESDSAQTEDSRRSHKTIAENIAAQRRRACSDLADVYPIDTIPNHPLAFTIRNCALPDSNFVDVDEDVISAALGHVAQIVYTLSFYLSIPLAYPVTPSSSSSTIYDPISSMLGSRLFPLYMPRAIFYRFEYGVFLLNKDIELLASKLGLKLLDIRQTLPNLKYILFVATAGRGELPARKAGGIRALLGDRSQRGTPDSSRSNSIDSTKQSQVRLREHLKPRGTLENGRPKQAKNEKDSSGR